MKFNILTLTLSIPVVNALANITTNYFPSGVLNPGSIRFAFMLILIVSFLRRHTIPYKNIAHIIYFFILYNLLLVLFNDNLAGPLTSFLKISIPPMLLFVGITIIDSKDKFNKLLKTSIVALAILIINYLIANYFGLGSSAYLEDSFYKGGATSGLTNEIAAYFLIGFIFVAIINERNNRWRNFTMVLLSVSLIIILLMMRRGAILTAGSGLFVIFLLTGIKSKFLKYSFFIGMFFSLLLLIYGDTLNARYQFRKESREGSITNYQVEGRYFEILTVMNRIETEGGVSALFGTHNLNSGVYFGGRELHVGYMSILHGSGLMGLVIFFLIFVRIMRKERWLYRSIKGDEYFKQLNALFFALIVAFMAYLLSSRLHSFVLTTPVYLVLGGIIGTMRGRQKAIIEKLNGIY